MKKNYKYKYPTFLLAILVFMLAIAAPVAAQQFKLPKYQKFTLGNGLTVYLMEQHEVPLVYVSAIFPAGAVKDNNKSGLASLTSESLLLGTTSFSRQQIEEKLDFLGANYRTSASKEFASLSMSFANYDLDKVLPILKEIILSPSFDNKEFDKHKKRLLLELEQNKEQPRSVIQDYYEKFLFGAHPYGNPISGFRSSVKALSLDDVKAFYKANYIPKGSAIAIVGDFKTSAMKKKVKKLFKSWKAKGSSTVVKVVALPTFTKSRVLLVDKDDSRETRFQIGTLGVKRSNPDYVAIQVINTILGGRFTSWLNDSLRVNAGLTYGAFSRFKFLKDSGTFSISSFTKTDTTVECIDLALEVIDRLHEKGVDQKTLDSAKKYIQGQFPPRYETSGRLAYLLTSMFVYNFNESFINTFQNKVEGMTLSEAKMIINKYFPKDKLQFLLIGNASKIKDKVKKYGAITVKDIKADGF
jgi:zinc protease